MDQDVILVKQDDINRFYDRMLDAIAMGEKRVANTDDEEVKKELELGMLGMMFVLDEMRTFFQLDRGEFEELERVVAAVEEMNPL